MKTNKSTLTNLMKIIVLSLFILSFPIAGIAQSISSMSSSEIETKTKAAVDAGDYDKAAQWKEVGELKKELDQAVQNSDYAKASQLKKEMDQHPVSGSGTPTPPPVQTETYISNTGSNYTPPPTSSGSGGPSQKTALLYQFGSYTPLGIIIAAEKSKGVGLYMAFKTSINVFNGSSASYELTNGSIDDDFWTWDYTGNKEYRRWSATIGMTFKLFGELDGFNMHGYGALGYGQALYMYEYKKIGSTGTPYGTEWLKNADASTSGLEFELGTILDVYGFALSFGWTTLNFKESMFTMGIGGAF